MKKQRHKKSILHSKDGTCYLCVKLHDDYRYHKDLHCHHVFPGTANRKISEAEGLTVYLCPEHHEFGPEAVHQNKRTKRIIQRDAQEQFEQLYGHERFMELFGRDYKEGT